jgi:hypothetical protein
MARSSFSVLGSVLSCVDPSAELGRMAGFREIKLPYELARKLAAKLSLANHAKDLAPFRFERGDAQAPLDRLPSPHLGIFLACPHPAFDPLAVTVHDPRRS